MSPDFDGMLRASVETFFDGWLPTPENINALPEPLRKFIHDLETRCDPAGDVRSRVLAEDAVRALEAWKLDAEAELLKAGATLGLQAAELERVKATARGSFDRGWTKGGDAMRAAIIREVD
jgi:hypothetical protein